MPVTVDVIKELSIRGMKAKFGDSVGTAYGFLMFGGFGVPGLVDGATLVATANSNSEAGNDFTMDMAVGLVTDVAKAALAKGLEFPAASTVLEFTGLTAEALASASTIVVSGLLSPSAIAPEPEPYFASSKEPEPATDSAPEPAMVSTPESASDSASEPAMVSIPESATDSAPEPATDSTPEPATDSAPEPATDSASEPAMVSTPEPASDSAPEPATEPAMESETAQESTPIPESNS